MLLGLIDDAFRCLVDVDNLVNDAVVDDGLRAWWPTTTLSLIHYYSQSIKTAP